jgi:general secretion pathway protein K
VRRGERGVALIVVLLVMAIVGVVGAEFAYSMRLEASAVRAYKEGIVANHLAEAAITQAMREIVADWALVGEDNKGLLTFYTGVRLPLPHLPREKVDFPGGQFSYRITDEESRINVNTSPPDRVDRLLLTLGLDKSVRDIIGDSLQDWRDPNEEHRLNGAESDYYLALPVPYRSHNANLESVAELLQIRGVTREIYHGAAETPGLVDLVSVKSTGQTNINTASPVVLKAFGLAEALVEDVLQGRRVVPYLNLPGTLPSGLGVSTKIFRVEAEGIVDGRVAARVTAVLQRRDGNPTSVVVLEWSGLR